MKNMAWYAKYWVPGIALHGTEDKNAGLGKGESHVQSLAQSWSSLGEILDQVCAVLTTPAS